MHKFFDSNSPEHVILHAQYRATRGKRPSMSFKGINNPREALKSAQAEMDQTGIWMLSSRTQALTANMIIQITEALGLRLSTLEELEKLLKKSASNRRGHVPFVEWDRNHVELNWFDEPKNPFSARTGRLFMAIPA